MAVAEAKMADKPEKADKKADKPVREADAGGAAPTWIQNSIGVVPRKFGELHTFMSEVRAETKKVTWPGRQEVRATTIVVIATTFFFGFYLYGLDLGFSWVLSNILKK
jgi:preprotein translocase subunit SecE